MAESAEWLVAYRLFGTKPLPEAILTCCHLDSWEQVSVKFESFSFMKMRLKMLSAENGGHVRVGANGLENLNPPPPEDDDGIVAAESVEVVF